MKSTDLISVFCRPVPFWSWNDKLEPDELRRQIGAMQDAGMGGFFMHARGGLETEYLSEDWFRAVEASVDEAKKRGMQAWCYDENGWPSSLPPVHEMARQSGASEYFVARKGMKVYLTDPIHVQVRSITTQHDQDLYLSGEEAAKMKGKKILIVDDVISTGESLHALEELVHQAGGEVAGRMAVLAEG